MDLNAFKTHGNSKSNKVFRPTMHSTFQQCKYSVATDEQLVYFILDEFESEDNIYQDLLIHHYQGMSDKFMTWKREKNREKDSKWHNHFTRNYTGAVRNCRKLALITGWRTTFHTWIFLLIWREANVRVISRPDIKLHFLFLHWLLTSISISPVPYTPPWISGPVLVHRRERQKDFSVFRNQLQEKERIWEN